MTREQICNALADKYSSDNWWLMINDGSPHGPYSMVFIKTLFLKEGENQFIAHESEVELGRWTVLPPALKRDQASLDRLQVARKVVHAQYGTEDLRQIQRLPKCTICETPIHRAHFRCSECGVICRNCGGKSKTCQRCKKALLKLIK